MTRWLPLALFTLAAAPGAETTPAPQPSPVASALPEIGRVRANATCQAIFEHARVAITDAVRNDRSLRSLARAMDKVNPGAVVSVGTEQRRAVDVLAQWATLVEANVGEAQAAIARLRALAAASPDETRKRELKAFADALSGALGRQKLAAHEVQRGLFLMGARSDVVDARAISDDNVFHVALLGPESDQTLRASVAPPKLRDLAATLAERMDLIGKDERDAVPHEIGATSGC